MKNSKIAGTLLRIRFCRIEEIVIKDLSSYARGFGVLNNDTAQFDLLEELWEDRKKTKEPLKRVGWLDFEKDGDRSKTSFIQNNLLRVDTQYYYYIYYLIQDFR